MRLVRCTPRAFGTQPEAWWLCGRTSAPKLVGALVRTTARQKIIVLTSRVSVEMVQKSAAIHGPIIPAVSAPTAPAVRMADAAGMALVAIARKDGFEVFTHLHRVKGTFFA
jgi:FdhD protein